jgi:hypothetical protein
LPGLYPITISDFICRNAERGKELFTLRYISGSRFQLDDNVQIEFEKGLEGTITAIKMLWGDGTESKKDKIRYTEALYYLKVWGQLPTIFCYLSGQILANTN